ncbi:type I restriction enzyme S subunit [Ureibacillus xyleni]|uniref:Type I restriction enzyme S subunit n=1 Tax=Ureibacillus xyleni TaxID=614648 RepID=A0A285SJY0_9BACL|nr:restriction endonuclease subunit S [Ureibacillus xyleni]SOC08265.1 type I restriction enzyme S subunit [Ureibacillus xyleni]
MKSMTREYKNSDIEWYDSIPFSWKKVKIGWLFNLIASGTTPPSNNNIYYDGSIPWLNTGDLKDGEIESTTKTITEEAIKEYSTLKLYPKGSLVMAMYGATIGKLGITKFETTTNQACCVMAQPINTNSKFIFYWLMGNRKEIINLSQGGGQPNINQNIIKNLKLYLPNHDEQQAIAKYLDQKTSEIDSLIADKEKLIELLEEKRQAIITEAVTKGLNSNVKMKDSGVEWIGEIPEHWEKLRIKNVASISGRIGFRGYTTQDIVDEGNGAITLSPSNIQNGMMYYDKVTYISWDKYYESPEIMLKEGYLIFCKTGSSYGKVAILKDLYEPMTINPQLVVIKPFSILPDYLYYVLESELGKVQVELIVGGGTMPTINQEDIITMIVTFPPYEEQKQIVEFLNNKLEEILTTITDIKLQINKLKEYRQSLIYEAVTGKIDVREYKKVLS